METVSQFVRRHRVRMSATLVGGNPHMSSPMPSGSTHWRCVLRCGGRQLTVYYSMGPALCREPKAADLLDCLASDAAGAENARDFTDWAMEYGYDPDSRRAERTYQTVQKQSEGLRRLVGVGAYDDLLWETKRL